MQEKDTETRVMNLHERLAQIRKIADAVKKDKSGYNYKYSDIVEILAKVMAGMNKYGVSLLPRIVPGTQKVYTVKTEVTKFDKTGQPYTNITTEWVYDAEAVFRWVVDSNPDDFIEITWSIVGAQSDPSQAFGSGITYCTRYFLTEYFQIAQTSEDPDAYRSKQKAAEETEKKKLAKEIVSNFESKLLLYLADSTDEKKQEVKKFIARYVKDANYTKITDAALASKLLNDFTEKYLKGDNK